MHQPGRCSTEYRAHAPCRCHNCQWTQLQAAVLPDSLRCWLLWNRLQPSAAVLKEVARARWETFGLQQPVSTGRNQTNLAKTVSTPPSSVDTVTLSVVANWCSMSRSYASEPASSSW